MKPPFARQTRRAAELFSFTLLLFAFFPAGGLAEETQPPRPKLVVGLVVDQMRWDYLYRYEDRYQKDGFRRLLKEGFSCENTFIESIPTVTASGHATIYSGTVPAIHGITGNDFWVQATGKSLYCTGDNAVHAVGSATEGGKMSPRNLWTSTITDELKLATNFRSRVIGIAIKDRAAILPAGHAANAAFWFDPGEVKWITSSYYMEALPAWVTAFNDAGLAAKYLKNDWNTLYPVETYRQSTADNVPYEGKFQDSSAPVLPVKTATASEGAGKVFCNTPYGNLMTLDLAREAIEKERLGKNADTDFLAVGLSSTDYIGHRFGPNSVEIEDTYLRLDRQLADFLAYLDTAVGKGNYLFFLTADHGASHNPRFLAEHGIPGGVWPGGLIREKLSHFLEAKYKTPKLVLGMRYERLNLNRPAIEAAGLDFHEIEEEAARFLRQQEGVAFAFTMEEARTAPIPEVVRTRSINGYNAERSGSVMIVLKPGWTTSATGGSHTAWIPDDAHIPLVWMGWGIRPGKSNRVVGMTDIAPTLAALLRIQPPNGCVGQPISEVLAGGR